PNRNAKASEKSEKAPVKSRPRKKTVNEREQNVGKRKTFSNDQKENSETDEDFLKLNQASGKTASKTNANCKQNKEMAPLRNSRKKNVKASSSSNQMRVDSSTGSDHNESTKEDIKRSAYFIKRESTETFSESNQKQENKRLADGNQRKRTHERKAKNSKVKLEQDEKYVESDSEGELMDEPSTSSAKRTKAKPKHAVKKQKPTSDQAKSLALSRNKTSTVSSSSSS
ncbi:unnamed protein product, partial [Anisakis simplex]|uniref:Transcription termination factor 1 n=1 Tax=Anisakis simplex TaxID=6269 RepID=A0A0M3JET5_ANISI